MQEDISTFFRDFSTPVSAKIGDGLFTFRGIFDDGDLPGRFGATNADLTQPRITCSMADASRLSRNVRVTVFHIPGFSGPGEYDVLEVLPEGTGLAVVILAPPGPASTGADALHNDLLDDGSDDE
ncbi:hypothetical protein Ga0100231_024070 [Opitutaceae bacterium TAV4]|nr:hypothetical protein Ga0100231_024070 [Opitutaceae bacterium TAV4]RRK00789.1 hypothetical protein Ga0100230_023645 [Opitutaceae bacterium TAV3]